MLMTVGQQGLASLGLPHSTAECLQQAIGDLRMCLEKALKGPLGQGRHLEVRCCRDRSAASDAVIYGYARGSTQGQSIDAQVKQLRAAGAAKIYRETASGAKTDRIQLRRLLDKLDAGDVLLITRRQRSLGLVR